MLLLAVVFLTGRTLSSYAGTRDERFYTSTFGTQQRLANGNTPISESHNGRAIEVAADGQIVWEYRHPVRQIFSAGPR